MPCDPPRGHAHAIHQRYHALIARPVACLTLGGGGRLSSAYPPILSVNADIPGPIFVPRADICSAANLRSGKSNSRGIEPEALRGHVGEFVAVQNNNDTSLQVDYSLLGPRAQLLIRALTRSTNDLANLALRDGEFRR